MADKTNKVRVILRGSGEKGRDLAYVRYFGGRRLPDVIKALNNYPNDESFPRSDQKITGYCYINDVYHSVQADVILKDGDVISDKRKGWKKHDAQLNRSFLGG